MNKARKYHNFIDAVLLFLCALLLTVLLGGCGKSQEKDRQVEENGAEITIYYLDKNGLSLQAAKYVPSSSDTEEMVRELLDKLSGSDSVDLTAPITDFTVLDTSFAGDILTINLSSEYSQLDSAKQALIRTAIVLTLTEVPDISSVAVTVDGKELTGSDGNPIGAMTRDSFVLNLGKDVDSYEKARLHLYFANEAGDRLAGLYRSVVYNSNISKEKLIVEELLKGPNADNIYPTINPSAGLISVTSKDGVCYVNFDKNFLTEPYSVTPEVAIYSIVNSLTEISDITKVQISIEGDTSSSFMEQIPLQTVFSRDLGLVEQ